MSTYLNPYRSQSDGCNGKRLSFFVRSEEGVSFVELHLESVFRFGIGRYFIGMRLTDII